MRFADHEIPLHEPAFENLNEDLAGGELTHGKPVLGVVHIHQLLRTGHTGRADDSGHWPETNSRRDGRVIDDGSLRGRTIFSDGPNKLARITSLVISECAIRLRRSRVRL